MAGLGSNGSLGGIPNCTTIERDWSMHYALVRAYIHGFAFSSVRAVGHKKVKLSQNFVNSTAWPSWSLTVQNFNPNI